MLMGGNTSAASRSTTKLGSSKYSQEPDYPVVNPNPMKISTKQLYFDHECDLKNRINSYYTKVNKKGVEYGTLLDSVIGQKKM